MTYQIIPFQHHLPKISRSCYISEGVKIIGDVEIGDNSSIWFNSVIRGDVASIRIGNNTNIQDSSVIHTSRFNNGNTIIGNDVTIGHMALIHACNIMNNAFIGMRAIVMDNAVIEEYGFVAAGALISPNKIVKSKELWAGVPAKFVRLISEDEISQFIQTKNNYISLGKIYSDQRKT